MSIGSSVVWISLRCSSGSLIEEDLGQCYCCCSYCDETNVQSILKFLKTALELSRVDAKCFLGSQVTKIPNRT